MNKTARILIIEDERAISCFITTLLTAGGYQALTASEGSEGVAMAASHLPDLILLDLGLPDMDGMDVLREIRQWSDMPIIVVSARQDEHEKVDALDCGANDYITKPFGNSELLARIRTAIRQQAILRRRQSPHGPVFSLGGLTVDFARRAVSVDGAKIHLTPIEYRIVVLLAGNAGKVLTHDHIIREIWGPFAGDPQVLRVNMANIRRKLEPNHADPRYILTEVGVGYRMADH